MKITYSAPVGVILSGEEGIFYGKPALGCTLVQTVSSQGSSRYLDDIIWAIEKFTGNKIPRNLQNTSAKLPINIPVDFEGVVAAEIVATTAVLCEQATGQQASQETINNISFMAHKKINPGASGLYTSLSSFGGIIYYRREFEFLKGIYKLPYRIPEQIEKELYISFDKKPDVYNSSPKEAEKTLLEQEKQTKRIVVAIIKEDKKLFFDQFKPKNPKNFKFSQSFAGVIKL